jgi:hypothetical protein
MHLHKPVLRAQVPFLGDDVLEKEIVVMNPFHPRVKVCL